jgi:septation ring formation regulator EzrA
MISNYLNLLTFLPGVFLLPALPYVRQLFKGVDVTKFSYGAATSGILLTFVGIWQGLIGFDILDTANSLPALIEGLKTAFGSSVVGLTTSMLINLLFVSSKDDIETSLERVVESLEKLHYSLHNFLQESADKHTAALVSSIQDLIDELEMGINTETKETMTKFRTSVEFLREWQEKYVDEIKNVTDAMDKNAIVTRETSAQLDRTNDVLSELAPVTEQIADSIGWVRSALPAMRKKSKNNNVD